MSVEERNGPEPDANARLLAAGFKWCMILAMVAVAIGFANNKIGQLRADQAREAAEREQQLYAQKLQEEEDRILTQRVEESSRAAEPVAEVPDTYSSADVTSTAPDEDSPAASPEPPKASPSVPSPAPDASTAAAGVGLVASTGEYRYPQMFERVVSEGEAANSSYAVLRYAINESYARHGYRFKAQELRTEMAKRAWYQPNNLSMAQIETKMSEIELNNVRLCAKYRELKKP